MVNHVVPTPPSMTLRLPTMLTGMSMVLLKWITNI